MTVGEVFPWLSVQAEGEPRSLPRLRFVFCIPYELVIVGIKQVVDLIDRWFTVRAFLVRM